MKQSIFYLTEYAVEVIAFLCGFIIILLIVLLYRIGNLTKIIHENLTEAKEGQIVNEKSYSENAILTPAEMEALLEGEVYNEKQFEKVTMQPEKLLTEVLDEVFL